VGATERGEQNVAAEGKLAGDHSGEVGKGHALLRYCRAARVRLGCGFQADNSQED